MAQMKTLAIILTTALWSACGDDDPRGDKAETKDDAGSRDAGAGSALYAVQATLTLPGDAYTSYVAVVPSLDKAQDIDYDKSLEVAAGAGIFGPEDDGYFIVGRADEPTLQRYDVTKNGELKAGEKLSLAAHGVKDTWAGSDYGYVFDAEHAYAFAGAVGYWIAEFNPKDMTLTRFIKNEGVLLPESPETLRITQVVNGRPHRHRNKVYVPIIYRSAEDDEAYPFTTITVLDMETGEVSYTQSKRCGPALDLSTGGDGFVYIGSYLWRYNPVGRPAEPPACLLRIDPETAEIDQSFYVETKEVLGGGDEIASVLFAGDGTPFTMVFHPDQLEITPTTKSGELMFSAAWTWMQLDPALDRAGKDLGGDYLAADIATFEIGGETYVQQAGDTTASASDPKSTLLRASKDGLTEQISMRGYTWGVVKVR